MTTNQTSTSLIERFNSDQNALRSDLQRLLIKEAEVGTRVDKYRNANLPPEEQKLLEEYRATFTWKEDLYVIGEYEVIGNFDYPIKCYSLKGLRSYLTGDSYFPDEGDLEAEGINVLDEVHTPYVNEPSTGRAEIQVYELKLKPQIIEEEIKRLKELQAVLEQNKKEVA